MAIRDYDKSLNRLIMILHKLWKDERPTIKELAEEFQVDKRTIQRDIYQRLSVFYIDKEQISGRLKFIDGHNLESSLIDDEMLALILSVPLIKGSSTQMQTIASNLLYKLVHPSIKNPYYIKPYEFEKIDMDEPKINLIEEAINTKVKITLHMAKNQQAFIEPYKIIAFDGIWYVLGRDCADAKIKTFFIHKIETIAFSDETFIIDKPVLEIIEKVQTPWFQDAHQYEVIIQVSHKIAHYFELRKHLPSQIVREKKKDGTLIISYQVSHDEEVDNLIKSWMPDIHVISPAHIKKRIINELSTYINTLTSE